MNTNLIYQALDHSEHLSIYRQSTSRIYCEIKHFRTSVCEVVSDSPRALISVIFEQRSNEVRVYMELSPPLLNSQLWQDQIRTLLLQEIDIGKKSDAIFIRMMNFNALSKKASSASELIHQIDQQIDHFLTHGTPFYRWSNMRNRILNWIKVKEIMMSSSLDQHKVLSIANQSSSSLVHPQTHIEEHTNELLNSEHTPLSRPEIKKAFGKPTQQQLWKPDSHFSHMLYLGSEFNSARGDLRSMNEITWEYLTTNQNENPRFFSVLRAQLTALKAPHRIYFDDVSRVLSGGKQSVSSLYEDYVKQSVPHHHALLRAFDPPLIVISGTDAFKNYIKHVLQSENLESPIVLRVWNPSPEAHRGSTETWLSRYNSIDLSDLLSKARHQDPSRRFFELNIPRNSDLPWSIKPTSHAV